MMPSQVDTRSNLVIRNPPKTTKIFLGDSGENLNFVHTNFSKKIKQRLKKLATRLLSKGKNSINR